MSNKHYLQITWSKAFDEIYCHHAALFIPMDSDSLFPPELACVGVNVRSKVLMKNKEKNIDSRIANYLPISSVEGGLLIPLNSSPVIDALSLNSWSKFRTGKRKSLKEFPMNIFYSIDSGKEVILPFKWKENGTPYLLHEDSFVKLKDGDIFESKIEFDL